MTANPIHNSSKQTLVLLIPDGVGVRNYLFSDIITRLDHEQVSVLLLHRLAPEVIDMLHNMYPGLIHAIPLPDLPESRYIDLLRKFCMFARLHMNASILHNKTISDNWFFFQHGERFQKEDDAMAE